MSSDQNQTQFSAEQPFFEQPVPLPQEDHIVKPTVPFFRRRKTIILLITIATIVLLLILFIVNAIIERNKRLGTPPDVSVATPSPASNDPLVNEVLQLRDEWKAADPSQIELQPPAIDTELRLEPKPR